jgi:molybdopterin molybdotransferase
MRAERSNLIPVAEARERLLAAARPVETLSLAIGEAAGRVLARDVRAKLTQPPFAASAMDGYALRAEDTSILPTRHAVIGEAPAGTPFSGTVGPGEAVRIFTGGAVPAGANTVVIQENTRRAGDAVIVLEPPLRSANIRAAGSDFREGDRLLAAGTVLDGLALSLAVSGNAANVTVYRRPRLAVIATGDELVAPGGDVAPGQIINSVAPGLASLAVRWGAEMLPVGHARDDEGAVRAAFDAASGADIVVFIGGASVGDYDLVKPALKARGLVLDFEKAALKPGKPVWAGHIGALHVLGLPGNPVSAFVCAHLFLKPLIHQVTGRDGTAACAFASALLQTPLGPNGGRESFLNGTLRVEEGRLLAYAYPRQDSSFLSALGQARCLIGRAAGAPAAARGAIVPILPLDRECSGGWSL